MSTEINKQTHPALWRLLHEDDCPYLCDACPFAELIDGQGDVTNDPSEAYYNCKLLEIEVWGEDAPCCIRNWREEAQKELGL